MHRSRWLVWQPAAVRTIEKSADPEPSKPAKPRFDGFAGGASAAFSITQAIEAGNSVAERRGNPTGSDHQPSGRAATSSASCHETEPSRLVHRPVDDCWTPLSEGSPLCQTETECWHCGGSGRCRCIACWNRRADEMAECIVCKGSGRARR